MSVTATYIIMGYLSSDTSSWDASQKKDLHKSLVSHFQESESPDPLQWKNLQPTSLYDGTSYVGPSHTRSVYISFADPAARRWVVKLETANLRAVKLSTHFPHAEEIAYKVSKLFGWNTVPKTKILHQSEKDLSANKKYSLLMQPFVDKTKKCPVTCTFQAFVEGEVLPFKQEVDQGKKKLPKVQLSSYQQAYLLGLILGKGDARASNTMCSKMGFVYEVDNEYVGWDEYESTLDLFQAEKNMDIDPEILERLSQVSLQDLDAIQTKYTPKDLQLAKHWKEEPLSIEYPRLEKSIKDKWDTIRSNVFFTKQTVHSLSKSKEPITLAELEKGVNKLKKAAAEEARAEARRKKEETEKAKQKEQLEKQKLEWEKETLEEPKIGENPIKDIHKWIQMGHCVVLHYQGEHAHIYYQGKETSIENIRVLYIDIAKSTHLLDPEEWPAVLKEDGATELAPKKIQDQLVERRIQPREVFTFRFGY